ncbi:MAG: PLP-dependent aminotransferase family protein [Solibacillus sp.]
MFIQINRDYDNKYIYQQIYESMKQQILQRVLKVNEKLPSKRQLATQLQVSVNSVTLAYEQLLVEGYIYTIERSGYFVEDIRLFEVDHAIQHTLPEDLKEQVVHKGGWLSLSHMSNNSRMFPFKSWLKHQTEAIELFAKELCELSEAQGPYILRKNIASLIQSTRGVKCEPEQIIVHSTTLGLLEQFLLLQAKDTVIALENPGYARYDQLLKRHQFPVDYVPLDKYGVDIEALRKGESQFLLTTPSHQFPTGKIMPISRRVELLNWALEKENRYIIEDDYDSEFKYKTDNIPSLQSLDYNSRVIYLGTFSKTLLPGMRISYMVLPIKLLREYKAYFNSLIQPANILAMYTLNQFIETGAYQKHVRKMNLMYEQLRTELIKQLMNRFGDNIEIVNIPAGLHFLVKVHTKKSYDQIEQALTKQKLELYTICRFLLQEDAYYLRNRYLIVGFANIDLADIDEALNRFEQALFH